jgi:hypothetical protein
MPSMVPIQHGGALRQSVQFPIQHRTTSSGPPQMIPLNHPQQAPTPVRHLQHLSPQLPASCAPLRSTLPSAGPPSGSRPQQRSWVPPPSAENQQRQAMTQPLRRYCFLIVDLRFLKIGSGRQSNVCESNEM